MKKIFLLSTIFISFFYGCQDVNDDFGWLDNQPETPSSYTYTIVDADLATIVKGLNANKNAADSATAKILNADKMFSASADPNTLIPYLLKDKYYVASVKSSALITYKYKVGRNSTVTSLSSKPYEVSEEDYKSVWGDLYVTAFTPKKSPEKNVPTILATQFANAQKGTFKNVEYYYSTDEPVDATVEERFFFEDFETVEAKKDIALPGWINKDILNTRTWQGLSYSNNLCAQASSNKSKNKNDIWLITPSIDITGATKPLLSFDVNVRYFNGECLSVLISKDFDGNQANITKATWTDVTSSFNIPAADMSALATAGTVEVKDFAGKKIYVAFRYQGDDTATPIRTTTYQVDNVKVFELKGGITVKDKSLQYAAYECLGENKWQPADKSILILQPADYEAMGLTYLTTAAAPNYLPTYLKAKFPYAQDGQSQTVVYKTSKTNNYADEYIYNSKNGEWSVNTFVIEKQDQFVRSDKGWMFDPTIIETLQKGKADTDGYMMVVNYVKQHQAIDNPALLNSYGDTEYYYGFNANYGNISYRDKDRSVNPDYPISGTEKEKEDFLNKRTIEGITVFLNSKYPNATAVVGGIDQMAQVTVLIYSSHVTNNLNENWTYTMQCLGNKEWKFIQRESESGTIETAEK